MIKNRKKEPTNAPNRQTYRKQALLDLLKAQGKPLAASAILAELRKRGVSLNKTTVYRQLASFKDDHKVTELDLGSGEKFYEMTSSHHHHLVCLNCRRIEDVKLGLERRVRQEEKKIFQAKRFKVMNHALEFFGLCGRCRDTGRNKPFN